MNNEDILDARNEFLRYLKNGHNKPRSKYMKKLQKRYDERHRAADEPLPPTMMKKLCEEIRKEVTKNA